MQCLKQHEEGGETRKMNQRKFQWIPQMEDLPHCQSDGPWFQLRDV